MNTAIAAPSPIIRPMTLPDYDQVMALMSQTPGISLRGADSREATQRYLLRNPGLSFVAEDVTSMIGCIMSGHDGRRGYLQHLVVLPAYRNRGIASALVERCLDALAQLGIQKSHVDVLQANDDGKRYWQAMGWTLRTDICRYSFVRSGGDNA